MPIEVLPVINSEQLARKALENQRKKNYHKLWWQNAQE
jgi:hypothetical protein